MTDIAVQDLPTLVEIKASPVDIIAECQEQAEALMNVVEQQKMFQMIKGKKFLQAEAWQLLGTFTGLTAKPVWTKQIESDNDVIFKARTVILNKEGREVSAGESLCKRSEKGKTSFEDNQILSTAQTRSVSKAYRNKISFIAKLAGFETSTAEEVEGNGFHEKETKTHPPQTKATTKPNQAASKVGKPIPKPAPTNGITVADFQAYRDTCLGIVEPEILTKLASNLHLDKKRIGDMTRKDLDDLLSACQHYAQIEKQAREAEVLEDTDDSPATEDGSEVQVESEEKMEAFPVGEPDEESVLPNNFSRQPTNGASEKETTDNVRQKDVDEIPF
jgi:hypothetical protein